MTTLETGSAAGLTHMFYPYIDHEQYLSGTIAYIEHARAGGGTVVVAADPARREQLAARLPDADSVLFVDPAGVRRNPGRFIPAWQDWIGRVARDRPVYGINESVWSGRTAAHVNELRYQEWLLNRAFASTPAWALMCPFDAAGQDASVVAATARCHPLLWDGAKSVASTGYFVGDYPLDALGEPTGPVRRLIYDLAALATVREEAGRFAAAGGLGEDRVRDLKLAVAELAANSIRHGGGHGTASLWRTREAVMCEFSDDGVITDPLVGLIRPAPTRIGGRGLWFVRHLCDLVQIRSSPGEGTRVRVSMDLPDTTRRQEAARQVMNGHG